MESTLEVKINRETLNKLQECAKKLEQVFHNGHHGFTTINHLATEVFELTTFVKKLQQEAQCQSKITQTSTL